MEHSKRMNFMICELNVKNAIKKKFREKKAATTLVL